jgi:hypothetical protein
MRSLSIEAGKRNMTIEEVMVMPEIDGWVYEGI